MLTIHNPFFSYREWSCSKLDDGTTSCVVSPEEEVWQCNGTFTWIILSTLLLCNINFIQNYAIVSNCCPNVPIFLNWLLDIATCHLSLSFYAAVFQALIYNAIIY